MLEAICAGARHLTVIDTVVDPERSATKPLFFYHVPRTGGLGFYFALRLLIGAKYQLDGRFLEVIGEPAAHRIDAAPERLREPVPDNWGLVATHNQLGFHRRFPQEFLLTTILREPFPRLCSDYTYSCMRTGRRPRLADIEAFALAEVNCNRATKQLAGLPYGVAAPEGAWRYAAENLERQFDSYVTSRDITALLRHYLSQYRLPNLISERVNATLPEFQFDARLARDRLLDLNQEDVELFRRVERQPRRPAAPVNAGNTASHTLVIREVHNRTHSEVSGLLFPTATLSETLTRQPELLADLSALVP